MKVIELFGGIGAIRKALIRTDIPYEVISYVENDSKCVRSYNALYGEHFKPLSVTDYHAPKEHIDLLMNGSPCQDVSIIGKKKGAEKGSGTRSSLVFETLRILKEMPKRPTWVLWENVKGMLNKRNRKVFFSYLKTLEELGYKNQYGVLNAMDFGIPQKRERVFVVSRLGKNPFSFDDLEHIPARSLSDFLEKNFDERYIVRQPSILKGIKRKGNFRVPVITDYAYTITTYPKRCPNSGVIPLPDGRYRYLTERECFYLMGFEPRDVDILEAVTPKKNENYLSNVLYRQAGNSIVVDVLMAILKEMQKVEEEIGDGRL